MIYCELAIFYKIVVEFDGCSFAGGEYQPRRSLFSSYQSSKFAYLIMLFKIAFVSSGKSDDKF